MIVVVVVVVVVVVIVVIVVVVVVVVVPYPEFGFSGAPIHRGQYSVDQVFKDSNNNNTTIPNPSSISSMSVPVSTPQPSTLTTTLSTFGPSLTSFNNTNNYNNHNNNHNNSHNNSHNNNNHNPNNHNNHNHNPNHYHQNSSSGVSCSVCSSPLNSKTLELEADLQRVRAENRALQQQIEKMKSKMVGILSVGVIEARGLLQVLGNTDAYVLLTIQRQKEKTRKIKNSINPRWDAGFNFYISDPNCVLNVSVYDYDRFLSDTFLGKVDIPLTDLKNEQQVEKWYPLMPKKTGGKLEKTGGKVAGEIQLRLVYRLGHF